MNGTIETQGGKTYEALLLDASGDDCRITLADGRRIPEIAVDFDKMEEFTFRSGDTEERYLGYSRLIAIQSTGSVAQLRLRKE